MSLDWNARDCARWDELTEQEKVDAAFLTMAVGIGKVTDENVLEFAARARALGIEWDFDRLMMLVGLSTNVSFEPRMEWLISRFGRRVTDARWDAARAYRAAHDDRPAPEPSHEGLGFDVAGLRAALEHRRVQTVLDAFLADVARSVGLPELVDYTEGMSHEVVEAVASAVRETLVGAARERVQFLAFEAEQDAAVSA